MRESAEHRFPFASLSMFGDQVQNLGSSALADFQRFKESSLALFFRKLRLSLVPFPCGARIQTAAVNKADALKPAKQLFRYRLLGLGNALFFITLRLRI